MKIYNVRWRIKDGTEIKFHIMECGCFIKNVSHPIVKWSIGDAWHRIHSWLTKKGAIIQEEEKLKEEQIQWLTKCD